jgi:hypothetical protein
MSALHAPFQYRICIHVLSSYLLADYSRFLQARVINQSLFNLGLMVEAASVCIPQKYPRVSKSCFPSTWKRFLPLSDVEDILAYHFKMNVFVHVSERSAKETSSRTLHRSTEA